MSLDAVYVRILCTKVNTMSVTVRSAKTTDRPIVLEFKEILPLREETRVCTVCHMQSGATSGAAEGGGARCEKYDNIKNKNFSNAHVALPAGLFPASSYVTDALLRERNAGRPARKPGRPASEELLNI